MIVRIEKALYQTYPGIEKAFVALVNCLAVSTSPRALHNNLQRLSSESAEDNPASYFIWSFEEKEFWVQQRLAFKSKTAFDGRLLTVLFYTPEYLLPVRN